MSHTTCSSSWISGENWDVSNWGEEAIFPMKCLILQAYFLLPKLCLTSSYEPEMTCHWVTSHFSCTSSSAAFGPTSSAFCQCYILFSLLRHKAQAGKWDGESAHIHCYSSCWATCVPGWAAHTAWLCADQACQEAAWWHITAHMWPTGAR